MSRVLLQICTAVLALVPISTGIVSLRGVRDPLYRPLHLPEVSALDSNLRFFGGVWLGLDSRSSGRCRRLSSKARSFAGYGWPSSSVE